MGCLPRAFSALAVLFRLHWRNPSFSGRAGLVSTRTMRDFPLPAQMEAESPRWLPGW